MKKIFYLLASLAIISSGASEVIACSDNEGATNPDSKFDPWDLSTWGNTKKQIIVKSYLNQASSWYKERLTATPQKSTMWTDWLRGSPYGGELSAVNSAFDLVNHDFNNDYVEYTYEPFPINKTDLKQVLAKGVNLIMKALPDKVFVGRMDLVIKGDLSYTATDQQKANAIINKIYRQSIGVPAGTNPDVTNSATVNALNTALEKANPTLTANDLKALSYRGKPLVPGAETTITVTATVGTKTANIKLAVYLPDTAQQIIAKIKKTAIDIAYNPSTDPSQYLNNRNIDTALLAANPSLTDYDLTTLTYTGTLTPGTAANITATATVDKITATTTLQVTMANSSAQKIIDKITKKANYLQ